MHSLFPIPTPSSNQILLKARIRHTRYFLLSISPVILVMGSIYPQSSLMHLSMEGLGHILITCGVFIRVFASMYIGGRKNDELVVTGLFSIVRNPLYVGTFLAMTGLCMFTASWAVTVFFMCAFALYYRITVAREELFLSLKFGPAYQAYLTTVPQWLPRFELWKSPEIVEAKPQFVLRTITDAIPYLIAMPLLETLCSLRSSGILPVLFTLP